ncbi:sterol desaturase family protein [Marinomonas sp. C2222]|uniref:Sterol desaturase family protein n=1 Tax=Marinomonas sargassi TaxID=2984494 RepID=A0ABT2YVG3_9GAMM|nr:sterol desaturase family protein [Marinomonas sargassi]MCV2403887.1 sterol desaturase family protein [Marinomonas sargassi]
MFDAFIFWLGEELASAGSSLFDLSKRVSLFYLVSASVFAVFIFYFRYGFAGIHRVKSYFSWRVWWHSSARTDYQVWLLNRLIFSIAIPKTLSQSVWISFLFFFWQEQGLSNLSFGWSDTLVMALFTLCYFLADDFSRFFTHWLMHKVPLLWFFHQVHHSAKVLTPFTVFRTHPVEGGLFFLRSLTVQSLVISIFLVLFPHQISLLQIFGVLVSTFVFNILGANLRHSGVVLSYGKTIEKWLISPVQHQIHHSISVEHYDKNFGVILAIWDRLFSTWSSGHDNQQIIFGTGEKIDNGGVLTQYFLPLKSAIHYSRLKLTKLLHNAQLLSLEAQEHFRRKFK